MVNARHVSKTDNGSPRELDVNVKRSRENPVGARPKLR
jgi:hypothetical protein